MAHFGTSMIFLVAASDATSDLADIRTAQLVHMARFSERPANQLLDIIIGSGINHRYAPVPPPRTSLPEPPISPASRPSTPRAARTKRSQTKLKSDRSIGQSSGTLPMDSFERDWTSLLAEIKVRTLSQLRSGPRLMRAERRTRLTTNCLPSRDLVSHISRCKGIEPI
jgi:hypothetical protein